MVTIEYNSKGSEPFINELASFLEKHFSGTRGRPRLFTFKELITIAVIRMHYGIPRRRFKGLKSGWSSYFKRWTKICKEGLIEEFFRINIKRFKYAGLIKDSKSLIIDQQRSEIY